jgi:uncharacterized protein (UPF0335 family)
MSDHSVTRFPGTDNNSENEQQAQTSDVGGVTGERLRQFIERIERLEEEKAALADDIKDVYAEAKSAGFDTKTMRQVVKLRKMDTEKRREENELLETYKAALGLE